MLTVEFSWESVFKSLVVKGKRFFFISEKELLEPAEFNALDMTSINISIGIGYVIMIYYSYMTAICANVIYLMAVVTLWISTDDFSKKCISNIDSWLAHQVPWTEHVAKTDSNKSQHVVVSKVHSSKKNAQFVQFLQHYTELQSFASDLNEILGELCLVYPTYVCFYYATELHRLFTSAGWIDQLTAYYLLLQKVATFILAAEICRKVCQRGSYLWSVKRTLWRTLCCVVIAGWLYPFQMDNVKSKLSKAQISSRIFPDTDYQNLMVDLSLKHVSISGMGLFSVDYSLCFIVSYYHLLISFIVFWKF